MAFRLNVVFFGPRANAELVALHSSHAVPSIVEKFHSNIALPTLISKL
jgi:hypothetical protein